MFLVSLFTFRCFYQEFCLSLSRDENVHTPMPLRKRPVCESVTVNVADDDTRRSVSLSLSVSDMMSKMIREG